MYSGWRAKESDPILESLKLTEAHYAFLPAPITWMEYLLPEPTKKEKQRIGYLLEELTDPQVGHVAVVTLCVSRLHQERGLYLGAIGETVIRLHGDERLGEIHFPRPVVEWIEDGLFESFCIDIYAMLAMINTPRVIGRRQHMPHAGLEKKLTAKFGAGKFPLHAWTEIKLEVRTPRIDESGMHEAHLTGTKALHFCRSHLRIRFGKLEVVSSHWRGDPALGIKRSRYVLVPPKKAHDSHAQ